MRSRIAGRLLPVALAAATVTALGAPATAEEAPPPAQETYDEADCAHALKILSVLQVLPDQPDLGRVLCRPGLLTQQEPADQTEADQTEMHQTEAHQDSYAEHMQDPYGAYINELTSTHATDAGQPVQENLVLGLPVRWPKSLTVHVPTLNGAWHSYSPPRY